MDEGMGFARWVRERRKQLQLTQKKLARLVGCAPVTIQKIEEGQRRPSRPIAEQLAKHLEIETQDLERFLRLSRGRLLVSRAPLTRLAQSTPGLPIPPTLLIGRDNELAALEEKLLYSPLRLLTLTGPPGVGKTRLALQLAHKLQEAFSDGVCFVPLAALESPDLVLPSLIRRLGFSEGTAQAPLARLQKLLREKRMLLLLDNFEHVLEAAPALSRLMEQCPGLRVLTTSRSALRLYGEQEWPVEPLPLPGFADVADNPAMRLFLERVRAFNPTFHLNAHNTDLIVKIVTRLEGLPLALELAAVRLRHISPEELAAQLNSEVLTALGVGPTDWPERQRTLQGAIAWSYERLEDRLKRIFRQVGIFVGGFDAPAARALCGARAEDLHALMDDHLLQRNDGRYTLLQTLRAYALECLSVHGELEAARHAHLEYYLKAVQLHQPTHLDWFEVEVGNLRSALRWALDKGKTETALRLAVGMNWFWETRGYQHEGLEWFKAVLALPGDFEPELRLSALNWGSTMAWQTGVFELSRLWLAEALALSRKIGHTTWEASLLMQQGKVALEQGQYQEALEVLEPALVLSRRSNTPSLLSATLFQLASTTLALGNQDKARMYAEEGLALCRNHPGSFWEPVLLRFFGELALEQEDAPTAQRFFTQALSMAIKLEHKLIISGTLADFAAALTVPKADKMALLQAARIWGAVEAIREANGYQWSLADRERVERWKEQARKRVADLEWNLAWASGRSMPLQELLEYALAEFEPTQVKVSR